MFGWDWQRRRLQRAEMELADAKHYKAKWVDGWWRPPSEVQATENRIARAEQRVEKLRGSFRETNASKEGH